MNDINKSKGMVGAIDDGIIKVKINNGNDLLNVSSDTTIAEVIGEISGVKKNSVGK